MPFSDIPQEKWLDPEWQLRNIVSGTDGLKRLPLNLSERAFRQTASVIERYPWASTPYYLSLVNWDDASDPVRRQIVPDVSELATMSFAFFSDDPLCEQRFTKVKGLVHRYPDRALVMVSNNCAALCRHCNRKRIHRNSEAALSVAELDAALEYVMLHSSIREVIFSGGDPLMLPLRKLKRILTIFMDIPHVEVLRIGTRLPVTMPMGITDELCAMLSGFKPLWINTQFNHPAEITNLSRDACNRLQMQGIPVSSQTVLLKGVNDDANVLEKLFRRLEAIMVRPYYLFHCEPVSGNLHFIPSIERGVAIMDKIRQNLGGLSLPSYVMDLPGGHGKAPLMPSWLLESSGTSAFFRTFDKKIAEIKMPC